MEHAAESIADLVPATDGAGPLLQRDYWAVLKDCPVSARGVARALRERFVEFPPEELVVFRCRVSKEGPLEAGDELDIHIRMAGDTAVRVLHMNENSLTVGTLEGHPEAGRITFGAYPNARGDVVFHIRSRARASSTFRYFGWLAAGDPMQTNTWTDFIDRLAHTVAEGVVGGIYVESSETEECDGDRNISGPTYIARGE